MTAAFLASIVLTSLLRAQQTTIDFEEAACTGPGLVFQTSPYIIDGYTFRSVTDHDEGFFNLCEGASGFPGSTSLAAFFQTVVSITRSTGDPFSIHSIDLAFISGGFPTPFDIVFTGLLQNGGQVFQTFTLPGGVNPPSLETYFFGSAFSNLVSVSWIQGALDGPEHQFDNVELSSIPEPSTVVLLGSGLLFFLSLEGLRRRRRVRDGA
jgi:hypothetical protein